MPAPSVTVFVGLSLDGFMADQDGGIDWLDPWAGESTADTGYDELMHRVDTLLIGRRTYDTVSAFEPWPYPGKVVTVLSHRPIVARPGEIRAQGPIDEVIRRLGESGSQSIYLDGGAVVRQAIEFDLVDELVLSSVPVMLGTGIRLFESGLPRTDWVLVALRRFDSGMVQTRYRRRR